MREYVYRERQIGWGLLFGIFMSNAVALPIALRFDPEHSIGIHIAVWSIFAVGVLLLGALTIEVDQHELRWSFGWLGWPRGRVALADIDRFEADTTHWYEGWGISRTASGMLYNISGKQALRVLRRDGTSFRLGTADLRGLHNALASRIGAHR